MNNDTLQYSNSRELFQVNGLKEWKGFTLTRQIGENQSLKDAAESIMSEMEYLHGLYSKTELEIHEKPFGIVVGEPPSKEQQEKEFIDGVILAIKSSKNRKSVEWHKSTTDKYSEKYPELGIAYRNQLQKFV